MDNAQLLAQLEALQAENARLRTVATARVTLRPTEKGALAVYGLRRFPIALYSQEWEIVLNLAPEIRTYLETHRDTLSQGKAPEGE